MPTFDALVEACARLLPELGYERLTTNAIAERAGASIGSLYEYFPGKDAIIAQVVERLVERVMARLGQDMDAILAARTQGSMRDSTRQWIERIYDIIEDERALIAVLLEQVPYTRQLEVLKTLPQTLLAFSERARIAAGLEIQQPAEALMLINNLVSTTILQILLEPPSGVSKEGVIGMLGAHVNDLIALRRPK